jgi:hypothetical protein
MVTYQIDGLPIGIFDHFGHRERVVKVGGIRFFDILVVVYGLADRDVTWT